jgi:hypothetical protein
MDFGFESLIGALRLSLSEKEINISRCKTGEGVPPGCNCGKACVNSWFGAASGER